MATHPDHTGDRRVSTVLSYGFRPFFLCASLWAAAAMGLWIAMMAGRMPLATMFDPVAWHAHEILFGYLGAVIAGFLLTAVPNWTGRRPLDGLPLGLLVAAWLAGRIVMAIGASWPASFVAIVDLALPLALAVHLGREIVAGQNWRNLVILALLLAYLAGNALFHLDAMTGRAPIEGAGLRLGMAAGILLIAVIGGRVVPAFTRNWLVGQGSAHRPAPPMQAFDKLSLGVLLVTLALWIGFPDAQITGAALILAGILHGLRLARWHAWHTAREPLVWSLHLAYAFLPLGALVLGVAKLGGAVHLTTAALHVWTVGAFGTMSLAVMTRATLGHTGAALHAGPATAAIYLTIPLVVLCRVAAPLTPYTEVLHVVSALLWIAAFLGFALLYGPRLLQARKDGG